ncbi:MAG TPA: secondary thiamine-phosphate synthase enzyme YjbQ [Steroidobacter sp.]|nr:secondary thiamine-phosphate synthase enzyme YjbQ [Steroidobacteraceae bacterium]HLS80370.1 secondary thiamine-phosphate synthase enzyme YjbQ [Steroidobacter sp.]
MRRKLFETMVGQSTPQQSFTVRTRPRTFEDITAQVQSIVQSSNVRTGLCHVFLRHTSASILICENADPSVQRDLERFMQRVAPDGAPQYEHDAEGPDDMPSHIRSTLAGVSLTIPVQDGRLMLGTWQGVYVWEHRADAHDRQVVVSIASL